jgi:hypothetical protein
MQHWNTPADGYGHLRSHNNLSIDQDNRLSWNGVPITQKQLDEFLSILPTMNPEPELILKIDAKASCRSVWAIRRNVDQKLACRESHLCGEGNGEWEVRSEYPLTPEAQKVLGDEVDHAAEAARR